VVSNVSVTSATDGGVTYVGKAAAVGVTGLQVSNVSTANVGGVFYFENIVGNINIVNSNFTGIKGTGEGGAISFSTGTSFAINQCSFINCSSISGHGGAISTSSIKEGSRNLSYCTFDDNSAFMNIGLDIYDSSNNANEYYTLGTVGACISNSSAVGDYILFAGTQVCKTIFFFFFM
jgi:hypothetical protein